MVNKEKGDRREKGERKWQGRAVEGRGRVADLGVSASLGRGAAREAPRGEGRAGCGPRPIRREGSTGGAARCGAAAPPPSFKKNRSIVSACIEVTHCFYLKTTTVGSGTFFGCLHCTVGIFKRKKKWCISFLNCRNFRL